MNTTVAEIEVGLGVVIIIPGASLCGLSVVLLTE